jgi:hypothetical protein
MAERLSNRLPDHHLISIPIDRVCSRVCHTNARYPGMVKPTTAAVRPAALALAVGVSLAVAGCSSSSKGSGQPTNPPSSSASASPTPSVTPSATTTPTPTPTPSQTPTEPAIDCRLSELSVAPGQSQGAAGSITVPILFKNIGTRTCVLQGYPGVAGLNAANQQVTQAVRTPFTHVGPPSPISIAPGQTASAPVQGSDVPVGTATTCTSYPKLLVTPPNETHSQQVNVSLPGCNGLRVGPVVAGTAGL